MLPYSRSVRVTTLAATDTTTLASAAIQSRLSQLTRGNKLETIDPMAKGFVLGLITILSYAYFLRLQTYVLYVEVVLNSLGICFVGSEIIFGLYASYQFLVDQQGY